MNESNQSQPPMLPEMRELWQQTLAWQPTEIQQARFQQLYAQILAGNHQLNLTRITEPTEFWEKHLWDSLRGVRQFFQGSGVRGQGSGEEREDAENSVQPSTFNLQPSPPHPAPHTSHSIPIRAIDIGTGTGLPGVAVAIAQPSWHVTLLDSTRKKIQFLDHLLEVLEIPNGNTLVDRVEAIGQQASHRQTYDIALVRAVAAAPICAEYALPLLKLNGLAILYRGQWTAAETTALEPVAKLLGGTIEAIEAFKTPLTEGDRHCLYLRKTAPTPSEFPRAVGIPTQKPLG
jgi:16S rRNA (guanine527-N7)-methyltransferase